MILLFVRYDHLFKRTDGWFRWWYEEPIRWIRRPEASLVTTSDIGFFFSTLTILNIAMLTNRGPMKAENLHIVKVYGPCIILRVVTDTGQAQIGDCNQNSLSCGENDALLSQSFFGIVLSVQQEMVKFIDPKLCTHVYVYLGPTLLNSCLAFINGDEMIALGNSCKHCLLSRYLTENHKG